VNKTADEWHILSDNELVQRARRLTIVSLVVGVAFLALAGWAFSSAPVAEQGGPARAVRIPYSQGKVAAASQQGSASASATAALGSQPAADSQFTSSTTMAPNPWQPKPKAERPAPPPPPPSGKIYDM